MNILWNFKPTLYGTYVEDIFVILESPKSVYSFQECMYSKHQKVSFSNGNGRLDLLLFLDPKICRKNAKFVASVCKEPIFREGFTNYESFIPIKQERGYLYRLFQSSFRICCDFKTFHLEIDHLNTTVRKTVIRRILLICVLRRLLVT